MSIIGVDILTPTVHEGGYLSSIHARSDIVNDTIAEVLML